MSPIVHVHGWSFFLWYVLFTMQAGLIRSGRATIHRALGLTSILLATVMITVGLIVSSVKVAAALGPHGDPFWALMGLPIFSIWVLFTVFYAAAIYRRRYAADHSRLMVLASAVALSAATFRIFVQLFGFELWVAIGGTLAPNLVIVAAMIRDYRSGREIHRVYGWGLSATVGLVGGTFLLAMTPGGAVVQQRVASIGRPLMRLY